jgi:hypothetical protein
MGIWVLLKKNSSDPILNGKEDFTQNYYNNIVTKSERDRTQL